MTIATFKKIFKRRVNFVIEPLYDYFFKKDHHRVNTYAKFYETLCVKDKTILYESRDGESMTDSPYAIFKYMLNHPDYQDYEHIWSVTNDRALSHVIRKYQGLPNVTFVERNSREYLKYLATAQYLINNSTFQPFFIPKEEQIYINTWHGTPLKHMGFDIPGDPYHSKNVLRNFLATSYLLSPNAHTTQIFKKSYKLDGLYEGEIIEEGYPRIDLTYHTDRNTLVGELTKLSLDIDQEKETILYAPTWKGARGSLVNNDLPQMIADMKALEQEVGEHYNLLVKVHPFLYHEALNYPEIASHLVPDFVDPNELMAAVDLLVTDYSSIFFDFLVTDKPILFYTWDLDAYSEQRGQYLDFDELPGPLLFNHLELIDAIKHIDEVKQDYNEQYAKMKRDFTKHDDGHVTERIVHYIFQKASAKPVTTHGCHPNEKKKILLYPGGLKPNGITSSVINLLNNIDYDQYDVTCFSRVSNDPEVLTNLAKINPNVRLLFRTGLGVYKLFEVYRDKFIQNRGANGRLNQRLFPDQAYIRESLRLFGKTHFDYAIDFNGYSLYWAKYLIVSRSKRLICFMHNDLLSDSERTVNGRHPHRLNLRGMFSLYYRFDKLVSVSEGTMEVNRRNLSQYAPDEKFDYVLNSISPDRIWKMALNEELEDETDSKEEAIEAPVARDVGGTGNEPATPLIENFISRAKLLPEVAEATVWNTLFDDARARPFTLSSALAGKEILISRKATANDGAIFYKFSYQDQMIGWIDETAVEHLPDQILEEQAVNTLAKVARPKNYPIYSAPYQVEAACRISSSTDYKDIVVTLDKEARTEHGRYCQFSINGTTIGWIRKPALDILESYSLDQAVNGFEKLKMNAKRNRLLTKNYKKNKEFVEHIANRTLREINFNQGAEHQYAKITNPDDYMIWSKAYPNPGAKEVGQATDYVGKTVDVRTIHETVAGHFYLIYLENERIGWLDARAFEKLEPSIAFDLVDAKATKAVPPNPDEMNFVNVGRLSPEKGQDNLIRAFAQFHETHPKSKLFILGQGPLKANLQALIKELDMGQSVFLMGQLDNPFYFMNQCDCFVLSSHYEGQPMVLLEALTLGMTILATDIVANRTVLQDGRYGYLVENSIEGLAKGMEELYQKETTHPKESFDATQYNTMAMNTFYKSLD